MRAWEYTQRLMQEATPVVLSEEEQTWTAMMEVEKSADALLCIQWSSRVPGSGAPESVIAGAVQSMENMGYDVRAAEAILDEGFAALERRDLQRLNALTARLYRTLESLPLDPASPYHRYKAYASFEEHERAVRFPAARAVDTKGADFLDRTMAGWTAQICGGALGTALEGYTTARLRAKFGDIRGYVREPNTYNDDITYEIAFLEAYEKRGPGLSPADVAEEWIALVPSGWSAEQMALDNIRKGVYPPESGLFRNPYREWIGAQMRGAICGQLAPGNPREAVRLAWVDGVVSHSGNGVLGEAFNAALVSLAYVEDDMRRCLEKAVALIPADSEYRSVLDFAMTRCAEAGFDEAWGACEKRYANYNWVHAYPNAAAEVVSLWFGAGDFDETMRLVAACGQDVDCNAAQIGTAIGAMRGPTAIAARWSEPIGDRIKTYLRGMRELSLAELSRRTARAAGAGGSGRGA
jgi:ADP-ribosylglycohydrolase